MIIKPHKLTGVFVINLDPLTDQRGYFMRTYDQPTLAASGLHQEWVQENQSRTKSKGTIRGLHFQLPPYSETKLIYVTRGAIFDVFVDLRLSSPTLGQWGSIELQEDQPTLLYIPKGFAHGFCTLTDNCEIMYKVDNYYSPAHESGIVWNDETLRINWPITNPILSAKDRALPRLKELASLC